MNNEAQNMQKFILMIVIVGVTLIVGIYILSAIEGVTDVVNDYSGTTTNETLSAVDNVAASSFAILSTQPTATCSGISVRNVTDGEVLDSGNYTLGTCTIILEDDSGYIGENLNVTYSYAYSLTEGTVTSNASDEVMDALATGTAWISILVVIGFATLVLGMLTSGLRSSAEEASTPYY